MDWRGASQFKVIAHNTHNMDFWHLDGIQIRKSPSFLSTQPRDSQLDCLGLYLATLESLLLPDNCFMSSQGHKPELWRKKSSEHNNNQRKSIKVAEIWIHNSNKNFLNSIGGKTWHVISLGLNWLTLYQWFNANMMTILTKHAIPPWKNIAFFSKVPVTFSLWHCSLSYTFTNDYSVNRNVYYSLIPQCLGAIKWLLSSVLIYPHFR